MPQRTRRDVLRFASSRRLIFVIVTITAYGLDLLSSLPSRAELDGHHWQAFDRVTISITEYVLLLAIVYSVLLLRERWPLAVLGVMTAVTALLWFISDAAQPVIGLLVALYAVAACERQAWRARAALGVALLCLSVLYLLVAERDFNLPVAIVVTAVITVGVWHLGRREHRMVATTASLRGELQQLGEEAAIQERQRIARELHDILAHSVSAMMMQAAGARAMTRAIARDGSADARLGSLEEALTSIETVGSQSMRELHRLLGALREGEHEVLDGDSGPTPGIGEIDRLVEVTRRSGLVVQLHRSGRTVDLDPSVRLAAYRVAQESLANAMKHGGRGAVVDVYKAWQPDRLQLQVRSRAGHEGTRPGTPGSGAGLAGLRERVELVGGTFEAGWVGDEFVTTAVLPLTAAPAPRKATPVVARTGVA